MKKWYSEELWIIRRFWCSLGLAYFTSKPVSSNCEGFHVLVVAAVPRLWHLRTCLLRLEEGGGGEAFLLACMKCFTVSFKCRRVDHQTNQFHISIGRWRGKNVCGEEGQEKNIFGGKLAHISCLSASSGISLGDWTPDMPHVSQKERERKETTVLRDLEERCDESRVPASLIEKMDSSFSFWDLWKNR